MSPARMPSNEPRRTPPVRRAPPEPLPNDGVRTVIVGTVLWGIALIALLPFAGRLNDNGRLWWIATCAVGFGLGLVGLFYCKRRSDALRRAGANPGASD
jgi:Protein of unknown function (DUF2530)